MSATTTATLQPLLTKFEFVSFEDPTMATSDDILVLGVGGEGSTSTFTVTSTSTTSTATDSTASFSAAGTTTSASTFQATAANRIVQENMLPGTPQSVWDLMQGASSSIEGFTTDISYDLGQAVSFKINTDSSNYRIDVYRLGYYGGDGARLVGSINHQASQAILQPDALRDPSTGLVDAGNWSVTDMWNIPVDAVSGIYIAKLVRQDGTFGENHVPFIVRNDAASSDIVFQTSDTTWQAYNGWGGANLYGGNGPGGDSAPGRAYAVSYNRPITTRYPGGGYLAGPQDFIFGVEHSAVRWLEMNGYDVSYIAGVDTARNGAGLLDHKIFLSVGHDEYWSGDQRANVEAARNAGVNLAFLSGNAMYWKTRWEGSIDGSNTDYRTLVSYKETRAGAKIDPSGEWTGTWRDLSYDPSLGGQTPENALQGTMFQVDSYRLDSITIPYAMTQLRFWRNTAVAETAPGETAELVKNLLGYEWDVAPDTPFTPDGMIRLSSTTLDVNTLLADYGTAVGPGTATHNLTLYRAPNGALVFGAGTVYWSWGLDSNHDLEGTPTDVNVQQAMVNLFADMGVQATTLQSDLMPATASIDFSAPTSQVSTPGGGLTVTEGQRVLLTGTAADVGGRVAAVEVSTDGGQNWRAATLTGNTWSYTWVAPLAGAYSIMSRAVDDSLNMGFSSSPVQMTVTPATQVTLFSPDDTPPPLPGTWDPSTVPVCCNVCVVHVFGPTELGVKFTSERSGTISGIRFYKDDQNTGPHVGNFWTANGTLLATATFTNESGSGWQQVNFSQPVSIAAGTVYVASYHTTTGLYLATPGVYFAESHTSGPLTALASDWQTGPNGLIAYGAAGTFPTGPVQNATNYWVDVVFNPASTVGNSAPAATADTGIAGDKNTRMVISAATLLANDTDPNGDPLAISGVSGALHGTAVWDAYRQTVTFTPDAGYTGEAGFTYAITDGRGGTATAGVTLTVKEPPYRVSLFTATDTPTFANVADTSPVELGVRFVSSTTGSITGIRFYKGGMNTGTHTAHLWKADGTLLASATFANETASGWQQVDFATPVAITAGQAYVAGYHTTSGLYSASPNYFSQNYVNGPLSVDGGTSGLFAYGAAGTFPNQTYNATNYWVDVVLQPASQVNEPPVAAADTGFVASRNTPIYIAASSLLSNDTDPNGDVLSITGVSGAQHGTVSYDAQARVVTFTPEADYAGPASFTYGVSDGRGGTSSAGVVLQVQDSGAIVTLFQPAATPTTASVNDASSIEVGMRFQVTQAGSITGIRFYKGSLNTGTHTANLWAADGTRIATATFVNETASGWQQVNFAEPVTIATGQTYVASYHTNTGYYSATPGFFSSSYTNGAIVAEGGANGVFRYGNSAFPTQSYNSTNYWVDAVFSPGNSQPVAGDDTGIVAYAGTPLVIPMSALLANDRDPNGELLTITAVANATSGTAALDASAGTVIFTPDPGYAGLAAFDYTVSDPEGGTDAAHVGIDVMAPGQGERLFSAWDTPAVASAQDPSPVEVGVRFSASVGGQITGIRFYKGALNTGAHDGRLWAADGTLLASATFTNETGSGWQQVDFAAPVNISAGQTYVASYRTSSGYYSVTPGFFASAYQNGVLTAQGGANGVFAYGSSGGLPNQSWNSTNYWVDVVMDARNRGPTANADSGFAVAGTTPLVIPFSALLGNDTDPDGDALTITGVSGATHGNAVLDSQARTVTFTAEQGYAGSASFDYAVSDGRGGSSQAGVALDVSQPVVTSSLFAASDTPATASVNDPGSIELGMRFQATVAGSVTGVRFYKGDLNTGTHTGSLWTATGSLLGSVTFANETANGWQQAKFATPVSITAGTDYVVSYHTNAGYYSATPNYFSNAKESGPLLAPSSASSGGNGLYAYGSGGFPSNSYNATNYWVDVLFQGQLAA
ncbi:DUF4082 domain-containing protein [Neoroseomonas soli]|uniref:DUF4082 domain-containing protein n=1 Tax=Neoroseomonas soli TaxID=1081025 RepID=A0A9X9WSP5_9PROT|nr:DUF4082 domain-containing protein [Neoroseomonas soli]MBR0670174.1 DUF4082 domain-containing protein [Neoroseomonas soli]